MADDTYYGKALEISDPSNCPVEVTPDDDTDLQYGTPNYILVEQAGNLVANFKDAPVNPVSLPLQAGYHPIRPIRILESSDVGIIIAFYGSVD